MEDFYAILGVSFNASKEEIKESYKKKSKIYHPDKGGTDKQFILINNAFEILMDDEKRYNYNEEYKQFYESILSQNYTQHSKDNEKIYQTDATETIKKQKSSNRNWAPIFSYILNGLLISSLFFLWYANEGQKKIVEHTNTILSQENSKLKQYYDNIKNDLSKEKTITISLQDKNTLLQNELDSFQQKNDAQKPSEPVQEENPSMDLIDIGSTEVDVKRIMGTPSSIGDYTFFKVWKYGLSSINFNESGKVDGWRNTDNNLKLK